MSDGNDHPEHVYFRLTTFSHDTRSESLEHFHMFHRSGGSSSRPTLEMHSDQGLFLVMTAAEYLDLGSGARLSQGRGKPEAGLLLQLPAGYDDSGEAAGEEKGTAGHGYGRIVRPSFDDGSLIFMAGEGLRMWMRAAGGDSSAADAARRGAVPLVPPQGTMHEVQLPADAEGSVRVWFGRMFFPPREALIQHGPEKGRLTFGDYRQQTYDAFHRGEPCDASPAGGSHVVQPLPLRGVGCNPRNECKGEEVCPRICQPFNHDLGR